MSGGVISVFGYEPTFGTLRSVAPHPCEREGAGTGIVHTIISWHFPLSKGINGTDVALGTSSLLHSLENELHVWHVRLLHQAALSFSGFGSQLPLHPTLLDLTTEFAHPQVMGFHLLVYAMTSTH